jgi:hypothetical protein
VRLTPLAGAFQRAGLAGHLPLRGQRSGHDPRRVGGRWRETSLLEVQPAEHVLAVCAQALATERRRRATPVASAARATAVATVGATARLKTLGTM